MKTCRGFTLLEILVALIMFAVVGGALLQLFGSGLRNARIATEQTHASLLARSKLTELLADPQLEEGTLEGDFGGGYTWTAVLTKPEEDNEDDPPAGAPASFQRMVPLELSLSITWGEDDEERAFTLKSFLLTQARPS